MHYPDFYNSVPTIRLYDPLAAFLGAIEQGEIEISYLDCVKLAGHSCPTVAGAYLMAKQGLEALYDETLPKRGNIKVEMQASQDEGVTGVIANVISFIVGAGDVGGFKGIQGTFSRNNLLAYDANISAEVKLTRLDSNQSVTLSYDPSCVPAGAQMKLMMKKMLQGLASQEEKNLFGVLWQKRVESILLHTEPTQLLTITKD